MSNNDSSKHSGVKTFFFRFFIILDVLIIAASTFFIVFGLINGLNIFSAYYKTMGEQFERTKQQLMGEQLVVNGVKMGSNALVVANISELNEETYTENIMPKENVIHYVTVKGEKIPYRAYSDYKVELVSNIFVEEAYFKELYESDTMLNINVRGGFAIRAAFNTLKGENVDLSDFDDEENGVKYFVVDRVSHNGKTYFYAIDFLSSYIGIIKETDEGNVLINEVTGRTLLNAVENGEEIMILDETDGPINETGKILVTVRFNELFFPSENQSVATMQSVYRNVTFLANQSEFDHNLLLPAGDIKEKYNNQIALLDTGETRFAYSTNEAIPLKNHLVLGISASPYTLNNVSFSIQFYNYRDNKYEVVYERSDLYSVLENYNMRIDLDTSDTNKFKDGIYRFVFDGYFDDSVNTTRTIEVYEYTFQRVNIFDEITEVPQQ